MLPPQDYIAEILKDSDFALSIFSQNAIDSLNNRITGKLEKGKMIYYVNCLIRNKSIVLKPEEIVRQLFLDKLINEYNYPTNRIQVEYVVQQGSSKSRADIVVFDKTRTSVELIIIEIKKPKVKEGKEQLKSYCNSTGAPMGVWTNGKDINYYTRKDPNIFDEIPNIPTDTQKLKDILDTPFTILDLMKNDKLKSRTLRDIIEDFEDEVLANAGVDVFEECFKLIFTKLYDEYISNTDVKRITNWLEFNAGKPITDIPADYVAKYAFRNLLFRNTGVESDTKEQIDKLFEDAKKKWTGIFLASDTIKLTPSHLQTCVSYLENVKLFNSNLEVVDDAFEYLVNKDSKGEKGQYFTPRYVIDMCVQMLNPQPFEAMIDTAAGSCGFPVHTIFKVWQDQNPNEKHLFTAQEKTDAQLEYVREKVFAIDFDEKTVRVGRTLNLIAGDGETNVLYLNSLDYERWEADFNERKDWRKTYGKGFEKLEELAIKKDDFQHFKFSIVMANPPFAGDIKDRRIIEKYDIARKNEKGDFHTKISRDILFIERNLNMLGDGGRMAIVLPQGIFNNSSDLAIRKFIAERCRILAVVGLHGNTFKPHTGTKTSVLLVQKWHPEHNPPQHNYPIFFATQQKEGKNNSGEKLYWHYSFNGSTTTKAHDALTDIYGHPIVYHDLFATPVRTPLTDAPTTATPQGIAEAFIEFAKKEKLSFWAGK